ncbi:MAG: AAA family ATPase, partial [Chloroflexi bacterium]|nr:AAA family ATPase [Chloroflexota bacterium]
MYLSRLALTNFRNFRHLELELPHGLVFLVGANAQGKTNLLEAAYLLAIAKSYRTNVEREMIHWSAQRPL